MKNVSTNRHVFIFCFPKLIVFVNSFFLLNKCYFYQDNFKSKNIKACKEVTADDREKVHNLFDS